MEPKFAPPDLPVLKRCSGECYKGTYTLNATFGCSHNCVYCYVPSIPSGMNKIKEFGGSLEQVRIKENVAEWAEKELRTLRKPVLIRLSTMSDIFQPVLKETGVTKQLFKVFKENDVRIYLMTKNVPDEETLNYIKEQPWKYYYIVTCANIDDKRWQLFEKGSLNPMLRLEMARELVEAGVEVELDMDPLIPGFDDSEKALRSTIRAAKEVGIKSLYAGFLFLRPSIIFRMRKLLPREVFEQIQAHYKFGGTEYTSPKQKTGRMTVLPYEYQREKLKLLAEIADSEGMKLKICEKKNGRVAKELGLPMCTKLKLLEVLKNTQKKVQLSLF